MKTQFTFADGLLLAVDLKVNNAMPGRDGFKKLTGLNEGQCRKIIDMIKGGFADYFFSDKRRKSFVLTKSPIPARERMADIHDADLSNFKTWEG